jgi:hypothetical protein
MALKGSTAYTVRKQLVDTLGSAAGCPVYYSNPAKNAGRSGVFIDTISASVEIATMRASTKARNEVYEIKLFLWAISGPTGAESDLKLQDIQWNIERFIADDPLIGLEAGVINWITETGWELNQPSPWDGGPGLYFSSATMTLEVNARNV